MVDSPAMWRLGIKISADTLSVVLHCPVRAGSLIYREIHLDPAADPAAAIQDAIYENPLLLQPFGHTDILVDTPRFTLVPAVLDTEHAEGIAAALWQDTTLDPVVAPIKGTDAAAVMSVDARILSFLRRTFADAPITHAIAPLVSYFALTGRLGNGGKTCVHLRPTAVDIIIFGPSGLLMANTFATSSPDDALYHIIAASRRCGLDPACDEMLVCGDATLRETIMPRLRQYHSCVMPVIFPSRMFRAGKDALRAPFELIVLPLCD